LDPRQVKDVETTSRGRGLLQGMGIGLASGVAVGGAVRVACPYDPDDAVTSWAIRCEPGAERVGGACGPRRDRGWSRATCCRDATASAARFRIISPT